MNTNRFARIIAAAGAFMLLSTGCGHLKPKDFGGSSQHFEPDKFFTGTVKSWGIMENRRGEPRSRFTTESIGTAEPNGDVRITQAFTYENGKTQKRFWHVHRIDEHRYEGTANDVVGIARGVADGNAFRWTYTIAVKPGNPLSHVHLTQWMYLPEGTDTMFTRAVVRKFGLTVTEVSETFRRIPTPPERKS